MTRTITGWLIFLLFFLIIMAWPTFAAAQKPTCLFDPGPNPPAWSQCGTLPDTATDAKLAEARLLSESRGYLWVLQLGYHENPTTPIYEHAMDVRDRLTAAGLWPYVVANSVFEETYEHCEAGLFADYGLPAGSPACMKTVRDWMGFQHAQAKAALGLPIVWITTVAGHPSSSFRPIPANTDFVAIDAYIPPGGTFDTHVAPILAFAEQSVAGTSMRLVQIPQWFAAEGWAAPSELDIAKYAAWAARPLWFATIGFTWQDRPWLGMKGLESLGIRSAVERAIRGQ